MTQCNERGDNQTILDAKSKDNPIRTCPSCGHQIKCEDKQVLKFTKVFYFLLLLYHCFLSTLIRSLCVLCFLVCSIKKNNNRLEFMIYRGYLREWSLIQLIKKFLSIWRERCSLMLVSFTLSSMSSSPHLKERMEFVTPTQRSCQVNSTLRCRILSKCMVLCIWPMQK